MIYGRLVNGRLSDIANRALTFAEDVPLASIPAGFGPFAYDAANQVAVPATLTVEEKADRAGGRLLIALALKSASSSVGVTSTQLAWAQSVIDAAATKALQAIA